MAEINIVLEPSIYAEIAEGDFSMLSNTSVTLDPISNSYSRPNPLTYYKLEVVYSKGITDPVILQNGKNSRFSCSGKGYAQIQLYIENSVGESATDYIFITVN